MIGPLQQTGETISHYRILRRIGGGGMGVVVYGDVLFDALEGAEALIDTVCTQLAHP